MVASSSIATLVFAEVVAVRHVGWPSEIGTWAQVVQATIAGINLAVVVYVFVRTRSDKRSEQRLAVQSFWLQKVIVEPHTKAIDDLHSRLSDLLLKASADAKRAHAAASSAALATSDEAVSSYAALVSNAVESLRFRLVPLLRTVIEGGGGPIAFDAASSVDGLLDSIEEATNLAIDEIFQDGSVGVARAVDILSRARSDMLKALFNVHRTPFEPPPPPRWKLWAKKKATDDRAGTV